MNTQNRQATPHNRHCLTVLLLTFLLLSSADRSAVRGGDIGTVIKGIFGGTTAPEVIDGGTRTVTAGVRAYKTIAPLLSGTQGTSGQPTLEPNQLLKSLQGKRHQKSDGIEPYVRRVGSQLPVNLPKGTSLNVQVTDDDSLQVYAFESGELFVPTGLLLQLSNEAELAAAIASAVPGSSPEPSAGAMAAMKIAGYAPSQYSSYMALLRPGDYDLHRSISKVYAGINATTEARIGMEEYRSNVLDKLEQNPAVNR